MKKLTVVVLSLFTLGILVFSPIEANAKEKEKIAYVDVAVATLWTEPGLIREIDAPSASNPVDMNAWIGSMNYEDKLWLVGNLETQALYGSKVTILEEQGEWVKVAVANQPTPRNDIGYPGWMPKAQLKDGNSFEKQFKRGFALVNAPKTWLYSDSKLRFKFMEVSFDTRLPLLQVKKDKVKVMTPSNGAKWIESRTCQSIKMKIKYLLQPVRTSLIQEKNFWGFLTYGLECPVLDLTVLDLPIQCTMLMELRFQGTLPFRRNRAKRWNKKTFSQVIYYFLPMIKGREGSIMSECILVMEK